MAEKGHRIDPWDFKELIQIQDIEDLTNELSGKAPINHTHTTIEVNGLTGALDGKAALVHVHPIDGVSGLQDELDAKAGILHDHDGDYAPIEHVGDAVAHITAEERSGWNSKADSGHGHAIDSVSGLQIALDAKIGAGAVGVANGVAGLDAGGRVPLAQLPSMAATISYTTHNITSGTKSLPSAGTWLLILVGVSLSQGIPPMLQVNSGTVLSAPINTVITASGAAIVTGASFNLNNAGYSSGIIIAVRLGN